MAWVEAVPDVWVDTFDVSGVKIKRFYGNDGGVIRWVVDAHLNGSVMTIPV